MTALLALWPLVKRFLPLVGILAFAVVFMIQRGEIRHWHKAADHCAELRAGDQKAWSLAAMQYRANVAAREAEQTKAKDVADDKLDDALARARAAAARYIGVRRQDDRGSAGNVAREGSPAKVADGTSAVPIVDGVQISADDVTICSVNTARLLNARDWALTAR